MDCKTTENLEIGWRKGCKRGDFSDNLSAWPIVNSRCERVQSNRKTHMHNENANEGTFRGGSAGFSLTELMVVTAVVLIIAGFAVPNIMSSIHISRLRESGSNMSG